MPSAWGITKTLEQWAADPLCQCSLECLRQRLADSWPLERALTTPGKPKVKVVRQPPSNEEKHSQYRGVTWNRSKGRWQAQIKLDGRVRVLGRFTEELQAARAFDKRAYRERGKDAVLNFPEEYQ